MKHLDLFSGIGGFALAARWAGIETVAFCEIEDFPRKVLAKNFPGVPIHRDIHDLDGSEYAAVDLITGGYPCQPFSLAGKRKGTADDRHLWPEMLRVITQARPAWVVCENVVGHITMGLDEVLLDLEAEGYAARAFVVPACGVDASHKRERAWVVGYSEVRGNRDECEDQREERGKINAPYDAGCYCGGNDKPRNREPVADTEGEQSRGVFKPRILQNSGHGSGGRSETGVWSTEPGMGRVADGIPRRVDRLRALGNAIVPQVAYEILRAISAA